MKLTCFVGPRAEALSSRVSHTLSYRRSWITGSLLLNNGTDIYTVSKMLTHKNVSTTQIYTEVIDDTKRKAAESIHLNTKNK